jgi:hypothetical protein
MKKQELTTGNLTFGQEVICKGDRGNGLFTGKLTFGPVKCHDVDDQFVIELSTGSDPAEDFEFAYSDNPNGPWEYGLCDDFRNEYRILVRKQVWPQVQKLWGDLEDMFGPEADLDALQAKWDEIHALTGEVTYDYDRIEEICTDPADDCYNPDPEGCGPIQLNCVISNNPLAVALDKLNNDPLVMKQFVDWLNDRLAPINNRVGAVYGDFHPLCDAVTWFVYCINDVDANTVIEDEIFYIKHDGIDYAVSVEVNGLNHVSNLLTL